ncbi:hypothetical protein GWI33_019659 [Rhynchophorus ferrugineus]|uniref:Uncharacterized protein n=1 Tax=Rhynchophorus ferrugineus TaxID=354439 RepID=A0A834HS96_RHYFE|nr:hypothetical protein GWI33_019659 [Rhynchophorus ferrugineus]
MSLFHLDAPTYGYDEYDFSFWNSRFRYFAVNLHKDRACFEVNRNATRQFYSKNSFCREGILDQYRRCRYYEKPYQYRRRVNFEKCKAIYNEDMERKIQFILRKNRVDPYPGCL